MQKSNCMGCTQALNPMKHHSMKKPVKALKAALGALVEDDPLTSNARDQLWRTLWAIENVNSWVNIMTQDPAFCEKIHKAIPDDNPQLLIEIKCIASQLPKKLPVTYIIGLINERL